MPVMKDSVFNVLINLIFLLFFYAIYSYLTLGHELIGSHSRELSSVNLKDQWPLILIKPLPCNLVRQIYFTEIQGLL